MKKPKKKGRRGKKQQGYKIKDIIGVLRGF